MRRSLCLLVVLFLTLSTAVRASFDCPRFLAEFRGLVGDDAEKREVAEALAKFLERNPSRARASVHKQGVKTVLLITTENDLVNADGLNSAGPNFLRERGLPNGDRAREDRQFESYHRGEIAARRPFTYVVRSMEAVAALFVIAEPSLFDHAAFSDGFFFTLVIGVTAAIGFEAVHYLSVTAPNSPHADALLRLGHDRQQPARDLWKRIEARLNRAPACPVVAIVAAELRSPVETVLRNQGFSRPLDLPTER